MQGPLVEGFWLAERLDEPQIRVIDLRPREEYEKGHLDNAVNLPMELLRTTIDGIPGMAVPPETFEPLMGEAGVSNQSLVVGYDDSGGIDAARLFWTLEYYGHQAVHVLNGTTSLWQAEVRRLDRALPRTEPALFRAMVQPSRIATLDRVQAALGNPDVVLVDTRSPREYRGEPDSGSAGHIPGAINLEWVHHLEAGEYKRLRPVEELRRMYESAGVTPDREVIVYCRTGHRSSHSYFVLRLLGYPRVRLYDGSWSEWGSRPGLPIER